MVYVNLDSLSGDRVSRHAHAPSYASRSGECAGRRRDAPWQDGSLEMTPEDIWDVARRCNMIERLFNLREGLTRDDLKKGDMLNHRYFDEPCRRGAIDVVGAKIDKKKFIKMIDELYEHKGLDSEGIPKPEVLQSLGLAKEPSHLL